MSEVARCEGRRIRFEIGRERRRLVIERCHHAHHCARLLLLLLRRDLDVVILAACFTVPSLARHHFRFLHDQDTLAVDQRLRVRRMHLPDGFAQFVAVALVLVVDCDEEFLGHVARELVLGREARRDAQMKRFFGLFLARALFESGTFAAEPKFDDIICHAAWCILGAYFDDALHVAPFGPDEPPSDLEIFFVFDLNVEAPRVLHLRVVLFLRWG